MINIFEEWPMMLKMGVFWEVWRRSPIWGGIGTHDFTGMERIISTDHSKLMVSLTLIS